MSTISGGHAGSTSQAGSRRIRLVAAIVAFAAVAGCIISRPAQAQLLNNYVPTDLAGYDVMPGVTVTSRLRPEYQPLGIRWGNLMIQPQVSQSLGYDSNVLGTPASRGSLLLDTQGSVQAAMTSPRSNLELGLDVDHIAYPDLPEQSYTNWSVTGGWSHEIGRDTVGIGIGHFQLNQLPIGIDSIGLVRPLPYQTDTVRLSYKAVRGPWTLVPLASFSATRFGSTSGEGTPGQLTGNNRNVESASLVTFYEFAPQRSLMFVVRGTTAQYTTGQPRSNYNDITVLTGLDYNLTGPLRFRALLGYETRDYQSSQFQNHSSPVLEATVIWTPTGLTTVSATATRRIEDANESINFGYTYTQARLVVDHEYLRNVLLQGRTWIAHANFLQTNDEETFYGIGAGATYLVNRNVRLSLNYDFVAARQNTGVSSSYNRSLILLQAKLAI